MHIRRVVLALFVIPVAFLVGCSLFREPQSLCFRYNEPGAVLTVRGMSVTSAYVPVVFSLPTGTSDVVIDAPDGARAEGTITVYDAASPELSLDNAVVVDLVEIDFCNFMADGDVYTVEEDGVITAYRVTVTGIAPTGFTLTHAQREGASAPATAIASPNGMYVASITWDPEVNASVLVIAEVSGKNPVVLASVTAEEGELALDKLSWSGSGKVAYATVTPRADGADENGNAHEETLYRVDVRTQQREAVRIELVP